MRYVDSYRKNCKNILMSRQTKEQTDRSEDINPIYGFYYFSDGQKIDDNNAEAEDENQYYES